jgi:hypothetical protein
MGTNSEVGRLPAGRRYYEDGGRPKCGHRSVVHGEICVCEFIAGHSQACERTGTMMLASAKDYAGLPVHKNFQVN